MIEFDFKGRVAVVTGGAQGLGRAIAERLSQAGAEVHLWDLGTDPVPGCVSHSVDVTCDDDVNAAADLLLPSGGADILICSAGVVGPRAPTWEYELADWKRVISINLDGVFNCCRALVPQMRDKNYGRILNIASIAGKEGNPFGVAYSAAKAGVIALTKSLGKELASHDISVNCLTPTVALTKLLEQRSPEDLAALVSKVPRNRFVTLDEVSAIVAWAVSQENSFATGSVIDLSGGRATY